MALPAKNYAPLATVDVDAAMLQDQSMGVCVVHRAPNAEAGGKGGPSGGASQPAPTTQQQQQSSSSSAYSKSMQALGACLLWLVCSSTLILANKYILVRLGQRRCVRVCAQAPGPAASSSVRGHGPPHGWWKEVLRGCGCRGLHVHATHAAED